MVDWTTLVLSWIEVTVVEKVTVVIMQHAPEVDVVVTVVVSVLQHEVFRTVDVTRLTIVIVRVIVVVFSTAGPAPVLPGSCDEAEADNDIALMTRTTQSNVRGRIWRFSYFIRYQLVVTVTVETVVT